MRSSFALVAAFVSLVAAAPALAVERTVVTFDSALTERAVTSCSADTDCAGNTVPYASKASCIDSQCSFTCNSRWVRKGSKCYVNTATSSSTSLAATATKKACKVSKECAGLAAPDGGRPYCALNKCSFICNDGYVRNSTNTGCTPKVSAEIIPAVENATSTFNFTTTLVDAKLSSNKNITAFQAQSGLNNTGAIASWFRASNTNDDTNGNSWCYYPYNDTTPGFAPSYKAMMEQFPNQSQADHELAGGTFCGLEAEFTTPDGRTALLYLTDAFDDKWVLTPTSVDVMIGSFPLLLGSVPTSKMQVVQNVSWKFTGRRNTRYQWRGQGDSTTSK